MLRRLNRERGVTILLVSHDLNLAAEVCDRLLLMAEGRQVAVGPPEAALHEARPGSEFGSRGTVAKHPPPRPPVPRLPAPVRTPRPPTGDTPRAQRRSAPHPP